MARGGEARGESVFWGVGITGGFHVLQKNKFARASAGGQDKGGQEREGGERRGREKILIG